LHELRAQRQKLNVPWGFRKRARALHHDLVSLERVMDRLKPP
jgi:hypothetical protein